MTKEAKKKDIAGAVLRRDFLIDSGSVIVGGAVVAIGAPTLFSQESTEGKPIEAVQALMEDGKPLLDVSVKLYVGGLLMNEQLTSSDGSFEFTELIDYARDVTIDVWVLPTDPDLVMENVLLKESTAAVQHGLYSQCVKRVRLDSITDFVVRLVDQKTRIDQMKRSGCLG